MVTAVGVGHLRTRLTYKSREMSLTKNFTLRNRMKVVVGTFFQQSGATLESLVSLSRKKSSLSEQSGERMEEGSTQRHL